MKKIAAEINLSETAFVYREGQHYRLRWFTPQVEVALCGHATLATAHVLWEERYESAESLTFQTMSGELIAVRSEQGIELNFPIEEVTEIPIPPGFSEALGVEPVFFGRTPVRYFAELESAASVRAISPRMSQLVEFSPGRVIVCARSDDARYDFISRYFAPGIGIPEDPVTGSTHCILGPYWVKKLGKQSFRAYQASARGGELGVRVSEGRVYLQGQAVTVMRGEFDLDIT
jgi:PhzF family phenazine biosynthesis protein